MNRKQIISNLLGQLTHNIINRRHDDELYYMGAQCIINMMGSEHHRAWVWLSSTNGINFSEDHYSWASFCGANATYGNDAKRLVQSLKDAIQRCNIGITFYSIITAYMPESHQNKAFSCRENFRPNPPDTLGSLSLSSWYTPCDNSRTSGSSEPRRRSETCDCDECRAARGEAVTNNVHRLLPYSSRLKFKIPKLIEEGKQSSDFTTDKRLFFGIELEIEWEEGRSCNGEISDLQREFGSEDVEVKTKRSGDTTYWDVDDFICKSDSSIGNEMRAGTEIVFQPRCLEEAPGYFDPILDYLQKRASSFNTDGRCGIHMHVGKGRITGEMAINLNNFYIKYKDLVEKISQRKGNKFANFADLEKGCFPPVIHHAAISQTEYTYEFRTFKGTLHKTTFLSYIQFLTAICTIADKNITLNRFIKEAYKYPELKERLKTIIRELKMEKLLPKKFNPSAFSLTEILTIS